MKGKDKKTTTNKVSNTEELKKNKKNKKKQKKIIHKFKKKDKPKTNLKKPQNEKR